ncbi:MAG: tetratricopeptide repeat protein [Pseudomonadota bacterium]
MTPDGPSKGGGACEAPERARPVAAGEVARRRLCVVFADVVGYSRLMSDDEADTFARWRGLHDDILAPLLRRRGGMLVKSLGDGVLATFEDPREAALWARDVQHAARRARHGLSLRIAINRCEVIDAGGDVAGTGVNIAARLQEHASAGGVLLTASAAEAVAGDPELDVRRIGRLRLRNLPERVEAWSLATDARVFAQVRADSHGLPAIAVLPFRADPADRFLGDGVVADIVDSLAGLKELVVVSRSSTLAFDADSADPREIARALGVSYIVTGLLRRREGAIRVSADLLDAEMDAVIASERAEFREEGLFEVQDAIVERVVAQVAPNVRRTELRRALRKRPASFSAYESCLHGMDLMTTLDPAAFDEARAWLEKAMEADPGFAMPCAWAARWYTLRVGQGWSGDRASDAAEAEALARRAVALDPQNAMALATAGHVKSYLHADYDTALGLLERAVQAAPSNALAHILLSGTLSFLSRGPEAVAAAQRALRLSPFDQQLFHFFGFLALAHYVAGDFEEAARWARSAHAENPRYTHTLKTLAAALSAAGRADEAREAAAELMRREPGFRLAAYRQGPRPFKLAADRETLIDRLRRAGVPD